MDIVTLCPFVASKIVWQAHSGTFALTVIVKATFVLRSGTAELASEQDPICERDRFVDDAPHKSLRIPSDLVPYKPRADVLLVGHAYAPDKQPVRSVVTRLVVGEMDKAIEVFCDRSFRVRDGQLIEGKRFTKMPLSWELTSGGPESLNPVGKRFDGPPDSYGAIAIGNLQPLGHFVSKRSDTFVPTCYAPIAPTWPGRTQRLGRLSRSILHGAWNARALPMDLDPMFFQAAPADQYVAEIRPNERICLENLHREHARLVTSLPGLRPRAIADRATGEREEIALIGDTLWVDTDRGVCCVVWRGRMGLRHPLEAGRIAIWVDGMSAGGSTTSAPRVQKRPLVEEDAPHLEKTMSPKVAQPSAALPFVAGQSSLAQSNSAPRYPWHDENDDATGTQFVSMNKLGLKATPFEAQVFPSEQPEETTPPRRPTPDAMPFVTPIVSAPAMHVTDPYVDVRSSGAEPEVEEPRIEESRKEVNVEKKIDCAPPPMIGPIATTKFVAEPEPKEVEGQNIERSSLDVSKEEPAKKWHPGDFPLEKCAALTASIARTKSEKARKLEAEEITEANWVRVQQHWDQAIKEETKKGRRSLLDRFDAAYVEQLEKERGPITVEEYARLSVAGERGTLDEALAALGLPRGAVMRVERVWAGRFGENITLVGRYESCYGS